MWVKTYILWISYANEKKSFTTSICFYSCIDFEKQVSELSLSLKNERQSRKSSESKVSNLEDELAEMRSSNTSLEKVGFFFNVLPHY